MEGYEGVIREIYRDNDRVYGGIVKNQTGKNIVAQNGSYDLGFRLSRDDPGCSIKTGHTYSPRQVDRIWGLWGILL